MYFTTRVQFVEVTEGRRGGVKKKKVSESYLVDAETITEAEARTITYLKEQGETRDYEIVSSSQSKIVDVIMLLNG